MRDRKVPPLFCVREQVTKQCRSIVLFVYLMILLLNCFIHRIMCCHLTGMGQYGLRIPTKYEWIIDISNYDQTNAICSIVKVKSLVLCQAHIASGFYIQSPLPTEHNYGFQTCQVFLPWVAPKVHRGNVTEYLTIAVLKSTNENWNNLVTMSTKSKFIEAGYHHIYAPRNKYSEMFKT